MRSPAAEAPARLIAPPRCRDQADLLTYFDLPIALMQTPAALHRVTLELVADLAADGTRYAEIRWAPRLHLEGGLSVRDVIAAVVAGVRDAAIADAGSPTIGLIVTAMRSHPPAANVELARIAGAFGAPVVGFDLAGPEAAYPAPPHAAAFRAAEEVGLELTAHAGEVPGAERIRDALGLGVRRIAQGATAIDDPELVGPRPRSATSRSTCAPPATCSPASWSRSRRTRSLASTGQGSASRSRPTTAPSPTYR